MKVKGIITRAQGYIYDSAITYDFTIYCPVKKVTVEVKLYDDLEMLYKIMKHFEKAPNTVIGLEVEKLSHMTNEGMKEENVVRRILQTIRDV